MPEHYEVELPFQLLPTQATNNYRKWVNMTPRQRSETTIQFAEWLVNTVRKNEFKT